MTGNRSHDYHTEAHLYHTVNRWGGGGGGVEGGS